LYMYMVSFLVCCIDISILYIYYREDVIIWDLCIWYDVIYGNII